MRVGFIVQAHPESADPCLVGGATKNPHKLILALRDVVEVTGVIVSSESTNRESAGYPVVGRRFRLLKLYLRTLAWNLATFRSVRSLSARSDVVQCHHPHLGLGAALVRRSGRSRSSLIVKAHGTSTPEFEANQYSGLKAAVLRLNARLHLCHDRFVLQRADLVVVSSDYQLDEMSTLYGVDRSKVVRIYNGVRATDLVGLPLGRSHADAASPQILFVGRVVPKKGADYALDLMDQLRQLGLSPRMTMVLGRHDAVEDAATLRMIERRANDLSGVDLRFSLSESELFRLMAGSDIGVVPSRNYESIPTVVIEMSSSGLPVFATRKWGVPEVVPEEFGLTGDLDEDAQRVAEFVVDQLPTWDREVQSSRHRSFDYEKLAKEYLKLYERVRRW